MGWKIWTRTRMLWVTMAVRIIASIKLGMNLLYQTLLMISNNGLFHACAFSVSAIFSAFCFEFVSPKIAYGWEWEKKELNFTWWHDEKKRKYVKSFLLRCMNVDSIYLADIDHLHCMVLFCAATHEKRLNSMASNDSGDVRNSNEIRCKFMRSDSRINNKLHDSMIVLYGCSKKQHGNQVTI